jgi:uncharacterized hydrophobic protein (TIGR00271 family)
MSGVTRLPSVTATDVARMRDQLFFEGPDRPRRVSRFWVLLVLAAVIAAAGVTADSTATVIGAMIVAPLMTPILGIVLAVALADRTNLGRSILYVVTGAIVVIAVGWIVGRLVPYEVVAATNSQVASRVAPRLIDLLAALATGAVGAVALARSDISDTLPGVAIAISLVPPLSVVGLTLESGKSDQAFGALLLFITNVTAILMSGIVVMALYRVHRHAAGPTDEVRYLNRKGAVATIVVLVVVVAVPLAEISRALTRSSLAQANVHAVIVPWAKAAGWTIVSINPAPDGVTVRATGPLPEPSTAGLRASFNAHGLSRTTVHLELVPGNLIDLKGG